MCKDIAMQANATAEGSSIAYLPSSNTMDPVNYTTIDPSQLSTFQRIILTTDGTLTDILESYVSEKIRLVKLSEEQFALPQDCKPLALEIGQEVIERKIVLQGWISRKNWIYAESLLVPGRLDQKFRDRLLISQEPMGRLWLEHRLETFKEIIHMCREPAGHLAAYFQIPHETLLLSRTYRVFSNRQPIIMITEKFPESFFRGSF
jgi:chorismate-pyruvate lyase